MLLFNAVILALNFLYTELVVVPRATWFALVTSGLLINDSRFALVRSTVPAISTLPGVAPIAATNVNTCPAIVTVSPAVGCVAEAHTQVPVRRFELYSFHPPNTSPINPFFDVLSPRIVFLPA